MGRPVGQGRAGERAGGLRAVPAAGRHGAGRLAAGPQRAGGPGQARDAATAIPAFLEAKLITARFYAEVILPPALAQLGPLKAAGRTVFALTEEQL